MTATGPESAEHGRPLDRLRESARGWLTIQLGVLGFIGLCGVLTTARPDLPRPLQIIAALLVLAAFAFGCLSILVVASVAWPTYGAATPATGDVTSVGFRLRAGLLMTVLALALVALAATANWWPAGGEGNLVRADAASQSFCGELRTGQQGTLTLDVEGSPITLPLNRVVSIEPVDSCQ
jgi:type IV secretory pathway VirB2 component (pilin)